MRRSNRSTFILKSFISGISGFQDPFHFEPPDYCFEVDLSLFSFSFVFRWQLIAVAEPQPFVCKSTNSSSEGKN
jgi:hypothetical protein